MPGPALFAGLPPRRAGARPRPLLRVSIPIRLLDDGSGARAEPDPVVHLLGDGWPLLVPADWILVPEARSGAGRGQGVLDDEGRRRRPPHRNRAALATRGYVRSGRASPVGRERSHSAHGTVDHHLLHLPGRSGQVGTGP